MKRSVTKSFRHGFTLAELLAVIALIVLLLAFTLPLVQPRHQAGKLTAAGYEIAALLEKARSHAMAARTYVWVGFAEDSDGRLVVGVVASTDGSGQPSVNEDEAEAGVIQIDRLRKWENVKLVALPVAANRPDAVSLADNQTAILSFSAATGSQKVEFSAHVIRFSPAGEARSRSDLLQKVVEVGLQSAIDGTIRHRDNYVAIQIAGLSGHVTVYQP